MHQITICIPTYQIPLLLKKLISILLMIGSIIILTILTCTGPLTKQFANNVLLKIPHRQFVFTFPKMLRVYFRDNKLFAEMAQLIN